MRLTIVIIVKIMININKKKDYQQRPLQAHTRSGKSKAAVLMRVEIVCVFIVIRGNCCSCNDSAKASNRSNFCVLVAVLYL